MMFLKSPGKSDQKMSLILLLAYMKLKIFVMQSREGKSLCWFTEDESSDMKMAYLEFFRSAKLFGPLT